MLDHRFIDNKEEVSFNLRWKHEVPIREFKHTEKMVTKKEERKPTNQSEAEEYHESQEVKEESVPTFLRVLEYKISS